MTIIDDLIATSNGRFQRASHPMLPELQLWHVPRMDSQNCDPTWSHLWPGGVALSRWILDHPKSVRGKLVLDHGSGSGQCAIAAALAGAKKVVCLERDPDARDLIRQNAEANGVDHSVEAVAACFDIASIPPHDVLLLGDCFYGVPGDLGLLYLINSTKAAGKRVLIGTYLDYYPLHEMFRLVGEYFVMPPNDHGLDPGQPPPAWVYST